MAIFIPPRGSKETLSSIVLHEGELVFNTTDKKFYTGDGETLGGIPVFEDKDLDTSNFATKDEIASLISEEMDPAFAAASTQFATKDELTSILSGELDPIFSAVSSQLATTDYVRQAIETNDCDYATKADVQSYIPSGLSQFANDANYAKTSDIPEMPDLGGFATKDEVHTSQSALSAAIPKLVSQLVNDSDYATKADAQSYIPSGLSQFANDADYATKAEIPSVDGFITVADADAKYATTDSVSAYVDENCIKSISEVYISLPEFGYAKVGGVYTPSGEYVDKTHEVIIVKGEPFVNEGNKPHSIISRLTNHSFEMIGESTAQNADGNISTSELDEIPELNALSYKLCTMNIGSKNIVSGLAAIVTGKGSEAIGHYSFAHGYGAKANGAGSHAEGRASTSSSYSHSEGQGSDTKAAYSHAEGYRAKTYGQHSHAEGGTYTLNGIEEYSETHAKQSHSEGVSKTYGDWSHAEGLLTTTSGAFAHSEGYFTEAINQYSHAEGGNTKACGDWSHAEGNGAIASGAYAHAEGQGTKAVGEISHTEGYGTIAYGRGAHAEGDSNQVSGNFAHAEGIGTIAVENYQHVEGRCNVPLTGYQHIVGNGAVGGSRKNIQTLDWSGNLWNAGNVEAVDFIAGEDKLTNKIDKTDAQALANAAEAKGASVSQSNYEILMNMISQLQDQIITLKQTNVEVYETVTAISDPAKDAVITVSSTLTTEDIPTSVANITAKSIQVKDLDVDSIRLSFTAEDDVKISNFESTGTLAKSISNASTSIHTNGYITIKDCTIGQGGYNSIEIGNDATTKAAGITIDNVHFTGVFSNNVILIFDTADDAIVNISNCIFDNCDNPLRISNKSNGRITVNIVNCEFTIWGNGGNPTYNGMILCQDYTSATVEAANENNLFAPSKVKINIINCTHNGEKITCNDPSEICGTKDENQVVYVYYDKGGFVNYNAARYPQITVK